MVRFGRKARKQIQIGLLSALLVVGGAVAPAAASPEAEAIVKKMLEQKADLLRQAESYVVNERHVFGVQGDMGILQPILFNGWVCLPQRYEYAIEINAKDLNKPAAAIRSFCKTERPVGHSIIRPKEVEYMLMQGRYGEEFEKTRMFPMMFNILGRGAEAMASANGAKQDFQIPQAKRFLSNALADNFELTDLQRDIANAIEDENDLREFGRVADVIGEIEVKGRPAWVLIAKGLNRKQINEDGEFTITGVSLAVDKERHVQIGMVVEGISKQGKRKKDINSFAIARIDRDYRPIQGTTALIPYESQMMVKFQIEDKKSQQELAQARKEYEKATAELETLKSTGALANIAMGNMFTKQFEAMERRLAMLEASAKSDFDLKTMNAEKMEAVLNGDGAGDVRRIEYAKKGDLYDYLALLANAEFDRDALKREYAQWQAQNRARVQAEAREESAKDALRAKELEDLRKQNESEGQ